MVYNPLEFKSQLRAYIIDEIKSGYPELDPSDSSVLDDLFINPIADIIGPIISRAAQVELQQNLSNAAAMTEEDLDFFGTGNYYISRREGNKASTDITLSFQTVDKTKGRIIMPKGLIFSTDDGRQYITTEATAFYPPYESRYFNKATGFIEFPVFAEAADVGSSYNADAGKVTRVLNLQPPELNHLISVTNKSAIVNGEDRENNVAYADRIRDYYTTRQKNTIPGYKSLIKELVPTVKDILVVGYKNKEMTRDLYSFGEAFSLPILNIKLSSYLLSDIFGEDYPDEYAWEAEIPYNENKLLVVNDDFGTIATSFSYVVSEEGLPPLVISDLDVIGLGEEKGVKVVAKNYNSIVNENIELILDKKPNVYWSKFLFNPLPDSESSGHKHLGGKVDIYVGDTSIIQSEATGNITSGNMIFETPEGESVTGAALHSIAISGEADSGETLKAEFEVNPVAYASYDGLFEGSYEVRQKSGSSKSYFGTKRATVTVEVDFSLDPSGNKIVRKTFVVGPTEIPLEAPLAYDNDQKNISGIEIPGIKSFSYFPDNPDTDFLQFNRTGQLGTSSESASVIVVPTAYVTNTYPIPNMGSSVGLGGDELYPLRVSYKKNDTLNKIKMSLDVNNNRNLCADVLVIPRISVPVDIIMYVKSKKMYSDYENDTRIKIQTSIETMFSRHFMGNSLDINDIYGQIYQDPEVYPYIQYINHESSSVKIVEKIGDGPFYPEREPDDTGTLPLLPVEVPMLNSLEVHFL